MKKSKLKNIIRESIKELMTEQSGYIKVNARTCNGGLTMGSLCVSAGAQVGDVYHVPSHNRDVFVRNVLGSCPAHHYTHYGQPYQISAQNCSNCCSNSQWQSQFPNFGGACTLNCGSTSAGSCNPSAWPNHGNWTSTYTNTVANHNNPCNFLNQKIAQFTNSLSGGGQGGAANVWQCKLDLSTQLHTQNNC